MSFTNYHHMFLCVLVCVCLCVFTYFSRVDDEIRHVLINFNVGEHI